MTFSIVAFDGQSGAYGVAVQSHWFNVGRTAPWVRFGVGVVATQAMTDPSYGWRGLDIMSVGVDAPTALRIMLEADGDGDFRQVALIDTSGRVAAHTGRMCIPVASHLTGDGWSVQGNLLANDDVIPAMADGFAAAGGTLAERMVKALETAEEQGGDLRGRQSAALRVVPGDQELAHGEEAGIDIRIADHPDPIGELRRLVEVDRAYRELRRGNTALTEGRTDDALAHLAEAASFRHGTEVDFWRAVAFARMGRLDEAVSVMRRVLEGLPQFREVLARTATVDSAAARLLTALESAD